MRPGMTPVPLTGRRADGNRAHRRRAPSATCRDAGAGVQSITLAIASAWTRHARRVGQTNVTSVIDGAANRAE